MYKVILVEDELLVRKGLLRTIDWASYNMEVIADVVDGQQALDLYQERKPDLIITDLQMPVMDGITLIERIRENDRETAIIILSCHDEFELMRKAISLNVSDYIFKLTMTEEETDSVLRKTQRELDNRAEASKPSLSPIDGNGYYKEMLFKDYIFYNKLSEGEFKEKAIEYNLNLSDENLMLVLMEIDVAATIEYEREEKHASMLKIIEIVKAITHKVGEVFYDNNNRYILLYSHPREISSNALKIKITSYLKEIDRLIFDTFNTTVSMGVSSCQRGYASLKDMLDQAQKMLSHAFVMGAGMYFFEDKIHAEKEYDDRIAGLCAFLESNNLLLENNYEGSNMIMGELREISCFDKKSIIGKFIQLFQWSATFFDVENKSTRDWVIDNTDSIRQCSTLEELINIYENAIFEIARTSSRQRVLGDSILRATQYMHNNFQENISLQIVADYLSLSPAYLSNLFKKKLGINFVDYLNKLRVKSAKKLLKSTSLRTYEIAEKVGFSDTTYFSKTFKKYTDLSPSSYRKHLELKGMKRISP